MSVDSPTHDHNSRPATKGRDARAKHLKGERLDAASVSRNDDRQQAEVENLKQETKDRRATRRLRFEYTGKVYRYLVGYSLAACMLLLLNGFRPFGFTLPDVVLAVVVGSTAVSAIGLVGFVVNGLFKSNRPQ